MVANDKIGKCIGCYVGDNLESRIPNIFKSKGCNCERTRSALNSMTPEECEEKFDDFVGLLVSNAKRYSIPEMMSRPTARKWFRESIDQAKEARSKERSGQQEAINELKKGISLSTLLRPVRLQRGQQGILPKNGNLPR